MSKREARKHNRRQTIVEAARQAFFNEGYAATSMSRVLAAVGGSRATLWSYFRSKEELFAAVIEEAAFDRSRETEGELLKPRNIRDNLTAFCRSFFEKTSAADAVAAWRLIVGESGRFPELSRIFYEKVAMGIETSLTDYIASQIAIGVLRDEDAEQMAQVLLSLCGYQQNSLLWECADRSPADEAANAARFTDYFLRIFAKEAN